MSNRGAVLDNHETKQTECGPGWLLVDRVEAVVTTAGGIVVPAAGDYKGVGRNVDRCVYGIIRYCGAYQSKAGDLVNRAGWPLDEGSIVELRCASPYETVEQGEYGQFLYCYQTSDVVRVWPPNNKPAFWPDQIKD